MLALVMLFSVGCAKPDEQPNTEETGEAQNGEKRPTPGETAHRADETAKTVTSDTFPAKPDELVLMDETIHTLSDEDATALYNALLKVAEAYQGEVARYTYTPESAEADFRKSGAVELRYRQKHSFTYQTQAGEVAGVADAFWIFLQKDAPLFAPLSNGKPLGTFLLFSPTVQGESEEAINEYRETVKRILQKNGLLPPEWQE